MTKILLYATTLLGYTPTNSQPVSNETNKQVDSIEKWRSCFPTRNGVNQRALHRVTN